MISASSRPLPISPLSGIDDDAVARAEAALRSLASQLGEWLEEELAKFEAAHATLRQSPNSDNAAQFYLHAHDLKGLGTTYDFPLISRIAASLCRLLDDVAGRSQTQLALVDAHVTAILSIVRQNIRDPADPAGSGLAHELETRVRTALAAA